MEFVWVFTVHFSLFAPRCESRLFVISWPPDNLGHVCGSRYACVCWPFDVSLACFPLQFCPILLPLLQVQWLQLAVRWGFHGACSLRSQSVYALLTELNDQPLINIGIQEQMKGRGRRRRRRRGDNTTPQLALVNTVKGLWATLTKWSISVSAHP